jgi:hypothetical protein
MAFVEDCRAHEIEKLLNCLRRTMYVTPSLRLGQLMVNITPEGKDLFYLTDEEIFKLLHKYADDAATNYYESIKNVVT